MYILFFLLVILVLFVNWKLDSSKDFSELVQVELRKNNMKLISLKYPGIFKVGPFEKFKISVGKPLINDGAIQYDKSYIRLVKLQTNTNKTHEVWVKIKTHWFKETKVEFRPELSDLK